MNDQRIHEILETYRPGEGLETDPEVRQALEQAAADEKLSAKRCQIEEFDEVFADKLRSVEIPETLYADILAKAQEQKSAKARSNKVIFPNWFHTTAFAAAAAILLLLALSFTFWNPPGQPEVARVQSAGFANPVNEAASALYASLNPSFRSQDGTEIVQYLKNHGATVPEQMPGGVPWNHSFACDVLDIDGKQVSVICFKGPDAKEKYHLFTFQSKDFADVVIPGTPAISIEGKAGQATWTDGNLIHVLYSDSGENNLRQLLDI